MSAKPRFLGLVHKRILTRYYSIRTEQSYVENVTRAKKQQRLPVV